MWNLMKLRTLDSKETPVNFAVSDDSEYESAGDASFVDTSFLVPSNSMQSAATKPSDAMDALIDGIANFQLITPCVDKPFVKPDFESPTSTSVQVICLSY
jgi:hypothetical protein